MLAFLPDKALWGHKGTRGSAEFMAPNLEWVREAARGLGSPDVTPRGMWVVGPGHPWKAYPQALETRQPLLAKPRQATRPLA